MWGVHQGRSDGARSPVEVGRNPVRRADLRVVALVPARFGRMTGRGPGLRRAANRVCLTRLGGGGAGTSEDSGSSALMIISRIAISMNRIARMFPRTCMCMSLNRQT